MDAVIWVGLSTVFATLLGPVLAVQAQKFLEARRGLKDQKMRIFSTLMATRASRLSPDHVQALNMIDLAFNGGSRSRQRTETDVLDAWRDYLDHLNSRFNEQSADRWNEKQNEFLITLLSSMAADLGLRYDRVLLRNGAYIPQGHMDIESEQHRVRRLAISVLSGEQPISMNVTGLPVDPQFVKSQLEVQAGLASVLAGESSIGVHIQADNSPPRTIGHNS